MNENRCAKGFFQTVNVADIYKDIAAGKALSFSFYCTNGDVRQRLSDILAAILKRYHKFNYFTVLRACLDELVFNAVKANVKRVLFKEHGLDMNDPAQYEQGVAVFKREFSSQWFHEYAHKAPRGVRVDFYHSLDGIRFEVCNGSLLCVEEEKRIRERMRGGMKHADLVSFFKEFPRSAEGAGLGLAMCVVLLRAEHLDPALLRIGNINQRAVARVEVPFSGRYQTVRRMS